MNKKKLLMFGLPLLAVVLVSATLLTYFGVITGLVTVSQGLLVDGEQIPNSGDIEDNYDGFTSLENSIFVSAHELDNQADVDAILELVDACSATGSSDGCDDIDTKYYETNLRKGTLELSKKDGSWDPIPGADEKVTVTYSTDSNGKLIVSYAAVGSNDITNYILVYYKDEVFTDDGTRLLTPAKAYQLSTSNPNKAIPYSDDGNTRIDADYCSYDGYDHCKGAKLWLIPLSDLNPDGTLEWTNWRNDYYFETDMLGWDHVDGLIGNPFTVTALTDLDFVIVSDFPQMMKPAEYTITTTVDVA